MIVDTSALMSVVNEESDAARYRAAMTDSEWVLSAGTLLEVEIVVRGRLGESGLAALRRIVARAKVAPVDERQVVIASDAYARYGRGSNHPARLNYGDCFSYALAISRDEPLLFKGDDFIHTDVRVMS